MARTSFHDIDDGTLVDRLAEAKDELFKLRFQLATNQLDNHARVRDVKRDIARILTVMRERELASSGTGAEERAR